MTEAKGTSGLRIARQYAKEGRIPFRLRLKAWWEGYDLKLPAAEAKNAKTHEVRAPDKKVPWSDGRIGLVQEVWGDGFDRPGGEKFVIELLKPVGLDSSMNVLELGAGLGGATRAIAKTFDVYTTGMETDANLAQVGDELSNIAGLGKKAPVEQQDLSFIELKQRGYDCVFSKEAFFTVPDKTMLLDAIEQGLKPGGHLLFTDYVLVDSRADSQELQAWREMDPVRVALWSASDYRDALNDLQLDIPISEDITARTAGMIKKNWGTYMAAAKDSGKLAEHGETVLEEAELWTRRLRALEAGELRVYRFHAMKKKDGRLLANW